MFKTACWTRDTYDKGTVMKTHQNGFSLIELFTTLSISTLLLTIGAPAYTRAGLSFVKYVNQRKSLT